MECNVIQLLMGKFIFPNGCINEERWSAPWKGALLFWKQVAKTFRIDSIDTQWNRCCVHLILLLADGLETSDDDSILSNWDKLNRIIQLEERSGRIDKTKIEKFLPEMAHRASCFRYVFFGILEYS